MPGATEPTSIPNRLNRFNRRPALAAAIALILGLLPHRILPDAPQVWVAIATALAVLAIPTARYRFVSTPALFLAIASLGAGVGQLEHFYFAPNHIALYTTNTPRFAELELLIDTPPRLLTQSTPGGRPMPARQVASGQVVRIKTHTGWVEATGQITLSIEQANDALTTGQRIAVTGLLSRPYPAMNPGQFDWARYYREQRVLAGIDAPHAASVRILSPPSFSLLAWLRAGARSALEKGFSQQQAVDHALLRALLLGDSDPQLRDVQDDFVRTGTSHHLSISGMHVAVLGGVVFFLCRLLRMGPALSANIMMAFVLLYGLVALPAPPVVRSIILCLTLGTGVVLRRCVDGVQLLALTVFVMLLTHPLDIYNAGFQLSFGTVMGLMIMGTPLANFFNRESEDDAVLRSFGIKPAPSLTRWLRKHGSAPMAAGLVAWAISAPLIIEHFDQVNPWAIPASLILGPVVFASMIGGLLKVVLTLAVPGLATWWAALAALPVIAMRHCVNWLAKVPASDAVLPALPLIAIAIYYILIGLPMLPVSRPRLKLACRGAAVAACSSLLLLPLLVGLAPRRSADLTLTLLSVGAGQCAVVQTPSGQTILIDAGSSTIHDVHRQVIAPFLRHQGVSRIHQIYVSHADLDHFSAVAPLADRYSVDDVVFTPYFAAHAAKNVPARLMLHDLSQTPCHTLIAKAGESIALDDQTTLDILWPPPNENLNPNNSGQVIRLTCRGRSILFTADIQVPAEEVLLQNPATLKSDLLIAPHHGSAEDTTAQLLEAVNPRWILASDDRTPTGKQRAFDQLTTGHTLLRTHTAGAITVTISPQGKLDVKTFLDPGTR